jgi:hypothetical protein
MSTRRNPKREFPRTGAVRRQRLILSKCRSLSKTRLHHSPLNLHYLCPMMRQPGYLCIPPRRALHLQKTQATVQPAKPLPAEVKKIPTGIHHTHTTKSARSRSRQTFADTDYHSSGHNVMYFKNISARPLYDRCMAVIDWLGH